MPPPALYPTQLAPHPGRGDLMSFRDGVFGRRPQEPFGQQQSAFENGILGPSLGLGETTPALVDGGPLRSYRDGIFNFPRNIEQTPHPVVAYQDGIFGGASLGLGAETANAIPNGNGDPAATATDVANGAAVQNGALAPPPPPVTTLDMTDPATITDVAMFLGLIAGMVNVPYSQNGPKTEWDAECSRVLFEVTEQLAANPQIGAAMAEKMRVKIGDLYYPTGLFFVGAAFHLLPVWNPASYPKLDAFFSGCMGNMMVAFPPNGPPTAEQIVAASEEFCPIKYPAAGISRAMMYYGGAVVAGGLLWLVLRR